MSNPRQQSDPAARNNVLVEHRKSRGWGRGRLASEFERIGRSLGLSLPARTSIEKTIYRHETGHSQVTDDVYVQLYCTAYNASPHELFGTLGAEDCASERFELTSHKFIPVYIGAEATEHLREALSTQQRTLEWSECWTADIEHPHGSCVLYGFEWGVVVYQVEEEVSGETLTDVAMWRRRSHKRELIWTAAHLDELLAEPPTPEYVLSTFWMHTPKWSGLQLDTAMRLLCMPRALLDHGPDSPTVGLVEQALLRDGYNDSRIVDFGAHGVSLGHASWAGVSYYPLAARRALPPELLVDLESVVQGLWCYCHHIRTQVEAGDDPIVPPQYGWRWLRGMRSRLRSARPRETAQHSAMRTAILSTSELDNHLTETIEMVRDTEREANHGAL